MLQIHPTASSEVDWRASSFFVNQILLKVLQEPLEILYSEIRQLTLSSDSYQISFLFWRYSCLMCPQIVLFHSCIWTVVQEFLFCTFWRVTFKCSYKSNFGFDYFWFDMNYVLLCIYSDKYCGFIYLRLWLIYFSNFLDHAIFSSLKHNKPQTKKKITENSLQIWQNFNT